ncbi:MAG: IS110 family transposase [Streptosporangiaceae bacterium]|nr:IS110 family transposase [Streptosporangiaceae bacterium]
MQVVYGRCAGLDVHKKTVVACVLVTQPDGRAAKQVRTFATMTADLQALGAWLREQGVEQVALESTGSYWWPVYNLLEEAGLALLLVNPQHSKQVPGRKTDVKDSEWLADLLRHGLLRGSFIPPAAIRQLRELTRYRKSLVQQRTQEANRLQKTLESANIKLASVASDVLGASGRAMVEALVAGEEDPEALADLARGSLRGKLEALRRALEGRVRPHHRVVLGAIPAHISFLEGSIAALDAEVAGALAPFAREVALLRSIPGVSQTAAAGLIAELGTDMGRFPSGGHLASWAGVCPGNKQSGGKRLSGATRRGNTWLRGLLGEIAWAAIRTSGSSFGARFRRLARRRGAAKAVVAVMHNLLLVIHAVLRTGEPYREAGADYYHPADPQRKARAHIRQLEKLGYTVTVEAAPAA